MKQLHGAVDSHGVADEKKIDACLRELDMCAKLRHPSVIMLLAAVLDPTSMCIVLEFSAHGDLHRLVHSKGSKLTRATGLRHLASLAAGMQYLHSFQPPCIREFCRGLVGVLRPSPTHPGTHPRRRS